MLGKQASMRVPCPAAAEQPGRMPDSVSRNPRPMAVEALTCSACYLKIGRRARHHHAPPKVHLQDAELSSGLRKQ
jgi:hypothetical protein